MASRRATSLTAAARVVTMALAIIALTTIAAGWLYWVRAGVAGWPGPLVKDALPLDELPHHDQVPLVVFLAVYAVAGTGLGLVARALRLNRMTAGLVLAAGTGVWLLMTDAFCLFVVRQGSAGTEFRAAVGLQPVYLAAALSGAAGALLGRPTRPMRVVPVLLTWLVAGGGLIDLASAVTPHPGLDLGIVERIGPALVGPAAHAVLVPAGVLLLLGARGLARRNRRAWRLSVLLLWLSVLLHLLRGPDYAAAVLTALVALVLLARGQDFPFSGDPSAQPPALLRLAGMLALAVIYGLVALGVYGLIAGVPFGPGQALEDTLRALVGLAPHGARYLPGDFAEWYPASVLSIAAIGVIWAAEVWVRPWRQLLGGPAARRERAEQIVREWGADTLAPFTLRSDKDWFFYGQTLIAYRVARGIALVSGDPVGPADEAGAALTAFRSFAHRRGWRIAILGASDRRCPEYRALGLLPAYHGDEAVIDTGAFLLEGRAMRVVRQAVHRVERCGYQAEVLMAGDVPPQLRPLMADVERAWLRGAPRKGFTMELDDLFRIGGDDALFVVGRDQAGRVAGFLHLAVCPASRSLSMSSMPRLPGTPNGFDAWLVTNAVAWAHAHDFVRLSLNFSPFAGLLASDAALSPAQRLERGALLRLKRLLALQLDNLLQFNRQFSPGWQPRYVVIEHRADLPRVAIAAMAAEGYLPHSGLVRGPGWGRPSSAEPAADGRPRSDGEPPADGAVTAGSPQPGGVAPDAAAAGRLAGP